MGPFQNTRNMKASITEQKQGWGGGTKRVDYQPNVYRRF